MEIIVTPSAYLLNGKTKILPGYSKKVNSFLWDASDLDLSPGQNLPTEIKITNSKTNKTVFYRYHKAVKDREGELVKWEYKPNLDVYPDLIIFND